MTGRDFNQQLAQHAAELGLDYTASAIRNLRHRLTDQQARDHMAAVAALLAFADHVFVQDAAVPFTQQQATQTLNRAGGNYEKACRLVRKRAMRAVETAETAYHTLRDRSWAETFSKEARARHARLTGAYEQIPGTLGHRFTAVMGFLADADLPRDRYRVAAGREIARELQREYPHHVDEDAKQHMLTRHPDIGRQLDYFARRLVFRARIEDLIAEACEQLADRVQDGWVPDPAHAVEADTLLRRYWLEWRRENRSAA